MKIKTIPFVPKDKGCKYVQLYEEIRQSILSGHMKKGDQLPSIRAAAKQLSFSKTTIENAYQRLWMEGYINADPQRGYFVDVDKSQAHLRKEIMAETIPEEKQAVRFDLRSSSIDPQGFDATIWAHYLKAVLQEDQGILSYGDPQGELILRKALQKYVFAMRGVVSREDQLIVGASFQSLLYLICSLFQGKKRVGMEIGGFVQAEQVFQDCGFTIFYLEHDEEGILLEQAQSYDLGMLYINSASCGTQKRALRSKRRNALLKYAKANQVLLLEDDHNGELRYQSKMRPAMQGFDTGNQVIYMRSFSKLLLPSIRMSFMVLNPELQQRYQMRKSNYNPSASKIEQLAFARYLCDGHMEKQIRSLRKRYEAKSTLMMQLMDHHFPKVPYVLDESGLQLWLQLPPTCAIKDMIAIAKKHSIYVQEQPLKRIALSFAAISLSDLPFVMETLAALWREMIPTS